MTTMIFLVNDAASGQERSTAWVTINEIEDGKLSFKVLQLGATGILRCIYFDVTDEAILNSLRVDTESIEINFSDNSNNKPENITNLDGSPYQENDLEVTITEVDMDKSRSYSFALSSTKRKLVLCDLFNMQLDQSGENSGISAQIRDKNSRRLL